MAEFTLTLEPTQEAIDVILREITEANERNGSGPAGYQPFGLLLTDPETGKTTGGLTGYALFDWLFVQFLAVPNAMRGQGIGTELLNRAESWARERGLIGIWLDTFAFGAPEFYDKLGFKVFGVLEDHPVGSRRYFFAKRFVAPTA
jgi:GNAT superfamily N-acetyltransferase